MKERRAESGKGGPRARASNEGESGQSQRTGGGSCGRSTRHARRLGRESTSGAWARRWTVENSWHGVLAAAGSDCSRRDVNCGRDEDAGPPGDENAATPWRTMYAWRECRVRCRWRRALQLADEREKRKKLDLRHVPNLGLRVLREMGLAGLFHPQANGHGQAGGRFWMVKDAGQSIEGGPSKAALEGPREKQEAAAGLFGPRLA